jgi:Ca-activated chloride channel family protein
VLLVGLTAGHAKLKPGEGCLADTMVVFDASGSMALYTDGRTRMDFARAALIEVLPDLTTGRKTGLLTYSGMSTRATNCDKVDLRFRPQADAGPAIIEAVADLVPGGWTPLAAAVEAAANVLDYRQRDGIIVLITDGEENCRGRPCDLARQLKASGKGLVVHVVGYFLGPAHAIQVACLAEATGGLYLPAHTFEELRSALRTVARCQETS